LSRPRLSHVVSQRTRTEVFAWYNANRIGGHGDGSTIPPGRSRMPLQRTTWTPAGTYRRGGGSVLASWALSLAYFLYLVSHPAAEVSLSQEGSALPARNDRELLGDRPFPRRVVMKLSSLFALDSFAGGFCGAELCGVLVSTCDSGVKPGNTRRHFSFGANIFAGISALLASRLGLGACGPQSTTMVVTAPPFQRLAHQLVPLMPSPLAGGFWFFWCAFSISQMDVSDEASRTRWPWLRPEERSGGPLEFTGGRAKRWALPISPLVRGIHVLPGLLGSMCHSSIAGTLKNHSTICCSIKHS